MFLFELAFGFVKYVFIVRRGRAFGVAVCVCAAYEKATESDECEHVQFSSLITLCRLSKFILFLLQQNVDDVAMHRIQLTARTHIHARTPRIWIESGRVQIDS